MNIQPAIITLDEGNKNTNEKLTSLRLWKNKDSSVKKEEKTMAKELGFDKDGQQKHLHPVDYFTDSLGQFGLNSLNQLTGQLTYFYTTKLGMAAGTVGTVLLVSKIFDAVSDLFMGKIVDKTNTSTGKARPWLLRMVVPVFLACVLLFTVPASMGSFRYIYALITTVFASAIVYTLNP